MIPCSSTVYTDLELQVLGFYKGAVLGTTRSPATKWNPHRLLLNTISQQSQNQFRVRFKSAMKIKLTSVKKKKKNTVHTNSAPLGRSIVLSALNT